MKKIFVVLLIAGALALSLSRPVHAAGDSWVIGRITGTYQELPGHFYRHPGMLAQGTDHVEFTGYRLVRTSDGKVFLIRPYHNGYFRQELPAGEYTLLRKRTDRPGYREPKTIDIVRFDVPPETLVNLGTINLVLQGRPEELLISRNGGERGKYTYRYRYEREPGRLAYQRPLNWFRSRKSGTADELGTSISNVDAPVTTRTDGSRVVIEFWFDPFM